MNRGDLERLSKDELIELVLRLQRPDKTSRNSFKPPSTDRKERREDSRPGGAKPGHEGHFRALSDDPDAFEDHVPSICRKRLFGAVHSAGLKFQGMSASMSLLGHRLAIRSRVCFAHACGSTPFILQV